MGGGAKRQRGRALAAPGEGEREVEVEPAVVGVLVARRTLSHSAMARARKKRRLQGGWVAHLRPVGYLGALRQDVDPLEREVRVDAARRRDAAAADLYRTVLGCL
jgi:hypothetical protein